MNPGVIFGFLQIRESGFPVAQNQALKLADLLSRLRIGIVFFESFDIRLDPFRLVREESQPLGERENQTLILLVFRSLGGALRQSRERDGGGKPLGFSELIGQIETRFREVR